MVNITRTGEGKVVLIAGGGKVYTDIAARFCRSSKSLDEIIASDYNRNLVKTILDSGHLAATEFDYFIFGVEGYSRVTEAQLIRKRMASYLIKSGRVETNGKRQYDVVLPNIKGFDSVTGSFTIEGDPEELSRVLRFKTRSNKIEDFEDVVGNEFNGVRITLNTLQILYLLENWYHTATVIKDIPEQWARYMKPQACEWKGIIGMNCYSDDTEVLTDQGWKFFKDLDGTEKFYSLDPDTKIVYLIGAKNIIKKKHNGDMIRYKARSIDLLTTPEHMNLVSYDHNLKKRKYKLAPAYTMLDKNNISMLKSCEGVSFASKCEYFVFPEIPKEKDDNRNKYYPELKVPMNDFLILLGFYLSDGCLFRDKKEDRGGIILSKGDRSILEYFAKMVSSWIGRDIVSIHKNNTGTYCLYIYAPQLYMHFKQYGLAPDKHFPDFVWGLDRSNLVYLYYGLNLGDGHSSGKKDSYCTVSKRLADDIQRLALHIGFSATISITPVEKLIEYAKSINHHIIPNYDVYRLNINKTENSPQTRKYRSVNAVSVTSYKGYVYCVELPILHTLYVRRNGKPVWSGNCHSLLDWFKIRCCNRAQAEIRDMANKMLALCKEASPDLFENAGPSCKALGMCPEMEQCEQMKGKIPQLKVVAEKIKNKEIVI